MASKLTAQQIYDKQFPFSNRGYNAEDVDSFLDEIIEDYQGFEENSRQLSTALLQSNKRIDQLKEEMQTLTDENTDLKSRISELEAQISELSKTEEAPAAEVSETETVEEVKPEADGKEQTEELTLEERVARLEKAVFASDAK